MDNVKFYGHLEFITAIWYLHFMAIFHIHITAILYILWPFGNLLLTITCFGI
jgi:hypothetical protein